MAGGCRVSQGREDDTMSYQENRWGVTCLSFPIIIEHSHCDVTHQFVLKTPILSAAILDFGATSDHIWTKGYKNVPPVQP